MDEIIIKSFSKLIEFQIYLKFFFFQIGIYFKQKLKLFKKSITNIDSHSFHVCLTSL